MNSSTRSIQIFTVLIEVCIRHFHQGACLGFKWQHKVDDRWGILMHFDFDFFGKTDPQFAFQDCNFFNQLVDK